MRQTYDREIGISRLYSSIGGLKTGIAGDKSANLDLNNDRGNSKILKVNSNGITSFTMEEEEIKQLPLQRRSIPFSTATSSPFIIIIVYRPLSMLRTGWTFSPNRAPPTRSLLGPQVQETFESLVFFGKTFYGVLPLCDDRRTPASLSSLSFVQSEAVVYLKNGLT